MSDVIKYRELSVKAGTRQFHRVEARKSELSDARKKTAMPIEMLHKTVVSIELLAYVCQLTTSAEKKRARDPRHSGASSFTFSEARLAVAASMDSHFHSAQFRPGTEEFKRIFPVVWNELGSTLSAS
ncbi:MAG: hypothetical protein EOO17_01185 [Chloroflexi bacterium]|nr:MAG: hypothetical protein EOO17_01185 [Chloroflexota bacterium]